MYRNIYVEIDNSKILSNSKLLCETFPHKYNIAVIKGNAYGHGYGIIPALIKGGMNAFAVSSLDEAIEVRKYDKEHPVIMLQPVSKIYYGLCSAENISVLVNDTDTLEDVIKSGESLKVQFKVNCGMNRLGYRDGSLLSRDVDRAMKCDKVQVEGIFSHFHTSGLTDNEYADNRRRFEEIVKDIDLSKIPMVHLDKTQTILLHKTPDYCNGARFGLSLYGFPSIYPYDDSPRGKLLTFRRDIKNRLNHVEPSIEIKNYDLKPALSLKTEVIEVNEVPAGEYVGYGLKYKTAKAERIAVIDVGYADGIGRKRLGTKVSINGRKYPIVGEVGMGMCQVQVDDNVKKGDAVTVLGADISIKAIASALETTTYEVLTNINSQIQRRYL